MPVYLNGKQVGVTGGGATELNDLSDVSVAAPQVGEILEYNGIVWQNVPHSSTLGNSISISASTVLTPADVFVNCETDISGGNIVVDLPPVITAGAFHYIVDAGNNADVNNIIIDGNGALINGLSQIVIVDPEHEYKITGHTSGSRWVLG